MNTAFLLAGILQLCAPFETDAEQCELFMKVCVNECAAQFVDYDDYSLLEICIESFDTNAFTSSSVTTSSGVAIANGLLK